MDKTINFKIKKININVKIKFSNKFKEIKLVKTETLIFNIKNAKQQKCLKMINFCYFMKKKTKENKPKLKEAKKLFNLFLLKPLFHEHCLL